MKSPTGFKAVLTLGILLWLAPGGLMAGNEQGTEATETAEPTEAVDYRHRLELFLGGTHEGSDDDGATGLSYEYRMSDLFGVGGLVEHASNEISVWTFGMPLYAHPYRGLRFLLAPGLEHEEEESAFLMRT